MWGGEIVSFDAFLSHFTIPLVLYVHVNASNFIQHINLFSSKKIEERTYKYTAYKISNKPNWHRSYKCVAVINQFHFSGKGNTSIRKFIEKISDFYSGDKEGRLPNGL